MPKKIFIIDDDPVHRLIARKLLERDGHFTTIEYFVNASEGHAELKKNTERTQLPDVILLDIEMPVMNGWEFMEEFVKIPAEKRSGTKVFIVSSSIADEDKKQSEAYPEIIKYITKPLTPEAIRSLSE